MSDYYKAEQEPWDTFCGDRDATTVPQGKAHTKAILKSIEKLQSQLHLFHHRRWRDVLWFYGAAAESLPEIRMELDRRNSEIWALCRDKDRFEGELLSSVELFAEILKVAEQQLHKLSAILAKGQQIRAPQKSVPAKGFQTHRFERLVWALGDVYEEAAKRRPAAGGQGTDCRNSGPFVSFVRAVLQAHVPEEAKRRALGQSLYELIRDRRLVDDLPG